MEGARPEWLELPPDGNNGWIPRRHNLQRNLQVGLEPSHQLAHGTFSLCCSLNSYSVRVHQAPFIALQSGPKELYAMGLPGVPLGVDAQGFFNSPDTGYYACAAQLKFEYATGGFFRIVISVNGQLDVNSGLQAVEGNKGSTNYFTLRVAGTTYMKTGDTISVSVFSDKDDSYRCEWCVCVCVCPCMSWCVVIRVCLCGIGFLWTYHANHNESIMFGILVVDLDACLRRLSTGSHRKAASVATNSHRTTPRAPRARLPTATSSAVQRANVTPVSPAKSHGKEIKRRAHAQRRSATSPAPTKHREKSVSATACTWVKSLGGRKAPQGHA